ncbi:helix-hairpin-helix domain-containing protein [Micromonospora globbae]|uniref:helix-hairpin-helix domain-containing protein n=1 Tax=Micromonospora globbae TaxID=1894969 RepID=UPI003866FE23|nr:helix-hairpin-helix domain-containing protein [Micromonospora globbae]
MSHDDESVVRRRLWRLAGQTPSDSSLAGDPGLAGDPALTGGSGFLAGPAFVADSARDMAGDGGGPRRVGVPDGYAGDPPGPLPSASALRDAVTGDDPATAPESSGGHRLPGPGAFDPGRRGVRVLAAVAALVVLGAGFWAWRSRPRAEPVPDTAAPAVGTAVPVAEDVAGSGASPAGELVVAVAGKVRRPGLVRLPAGARLADAVEAAGGALPGVDVALLNPARRVADGELILVGVTAPPAAAGQVPPAPGGAPAPTGIPGAGGKLNLNTATLAQLDALPGVGPVLAQRILTHREQHGGFRSVGDLRQVDGIGDARYEQLKDLVTV